MPRERTIYRAYFLQQTEAARKFANCPDTQVGTWIPKSVFTYYANDGQVNVKFSVEGWKEKDIETAGFSEA